MILDLRRVQGFREQSFVAAAMVNRAFRHGICHWLTAPAICSRFLGSDTVAVKDNVTCWSAYILNSIVPLISAKKKSVCRDEVAFFSVPR